MIYKVLSLYYLHLYPPVAAFFFFYWELLGTSGITFRYISRLSLQQQQKKDRRQPKQSTRYLKQHKFNSQKHWMNDLQSTFLILSASFSSTSCCFSSGNFWDNFKKWLLFSLKLRVCVVAVCPFTEKNWQELAVFFPPSVTLLSIMLWSRAVM